MIERVTEIHAELADVRAERDTLASVRCNCEEGRAVVAAWVEGMAAEGAAALRRDLEAVAGTGAFPGGSLKVRPDYGKDLAPLLVALIGPKAITRALSEHLDALPDVPPAAERAALIAELDARADALEREEERLICESEDTPTPIMRRPDCRPEIVLALVPRVAATPDTSEAAA